MKYPRLLVLGIAAFCSRTAVPAPLPGELPRVPPTASDQAVKTFQLHKGLRIELVASEPLIGSPVGISFDEDGRLFVVEMRDYPDEPEKKLGRIVMLRDSKGDGKYDKATVFAEHLPWPTSCLWAGGGLFVTSTPDVLWLKDTRNAGTADERDVVFTGFGAGVDRLNVQALVNNLRWGPDDRIHGATSFNGGVVSRPGNADPPLNLHGRDFSFDLRTRDLRAESGGGQHGLNFDSWGRKFVCMNSDPLEAFMYDLRYGARNPRLAMPPPLLTHVFADGSDVFRISPDEAWRVLRTKWRISGLVTGPVEGGGRPSGYFTGVSGITIYTGDALPAEFRDNAFIGEVANNLVHREIITWDGLRPVAHRAPEEQKSEFLASRDTWFRPAQMANGPDGALYIVDMYREVIEHPWSLPDSIREHLDLHSGVNRGRIWRVVPENFVPRKPPRLSKASTAELVALLEHPNGWHRTTAARLLYERQDAAVTPLLEKLLKESKSAVGRLHALCCLDGLHALGESQLLTALADADSHVQERAVLLCEPFLRSRDCPPALWKKLREMAADDSIAVRYQLAFSLGERHEKDRFVPLAQIARRDAADPWIQSAVLSSAAGGEADLLQMLFAIPSTRTDPAAGQFVERLALLIGQSGAASPVSAVIGDVETLTEPKDARLAFLIARALRDGLRRARGQSGAALPMDSLLSRARKLASDSSINEPTRVAAVRLLGTGGYAESAGVLVPMLSPASSEGLQVAAVEALDEMSDPAVGPELVKRLGSLGPRARGASLSALLRQPQRAIVMLQAIESGAARPSDITSAQANFLRNHSDPKVRELARKCLPVLGARQKVIDDYMPALALTGDAARGRAIFQQRCSSCHRLGSDGFAVGPDLTTVRNAGKEKMLVNILDPNREVAPNYVAYAVETRGGDSLVGIIAAETASSVTVRQPFGKDTVVPRSDIRRVRSQQMSLMPEGLEQGLKPQDMADLLEFVFTAK